MKLSIPVHEAVLCKAESTRGVSISLAGRHLVLKAHAYSDAKPLPVSVERKRAKHMVQVSKDAFGKAETEIAFGKDPLEGAKRFFHGNLLHYLFFLETPAGKPVAYAQVAISEPHESAYYTSAAISPEAQGKGVYELLNVLRAAACVRHLGANAQFGVATRSENPKVIMHYSARGWFPIQKKGSIEFSDRHREGLKKSRLAFLIGRLGVSPDTKHVAEITRRVEQLYRTGPAEAGTYSGKIATVTPDERAAEFLRRINVVDNGKTREFDAAKGDSLYLVTSSANLVNWLESQK